MCLSKLQHWAHVTHPFKNPQRLSKTLGINSKHHSLWSPVYSPASAVTTSFPALKAFTGCLQSPKYVLGTVPSVWNNPSYCSSAWLGPAFSPPSSLGLGARSLCSLRACIHLYLPKKSHLSPDLNCPLGARGTPLWGAHTEWGPARPESSTAYGNSSTNSFWMNTFMNL